MGRVVGCAVCPRNVGLTDRTAAPEGITVLRTVVGNSVGRACVGNWVGRGAVGADGLKVIAPVGKRVGGR